MATKIRAGLYETSYRVDSSTLAVYTIEKDPEGFEQSGWWVRCEVGNDTDWWDQPFLTKREAVEAIKEVAGNYEYKRGLGWCYVG